MSYNNLDFKAVIVTAGIGQRLDSLTKKIPKLLLQFRDGQSILEYTLLSMNEADLFNKVVIVTGYLHSKVINTIESIKPKIKFGINCIFNPQFDTKSVLYSVEKGIGDVGDGYFSKKIQIFLVNISFNINHLFGKKNLIFEITSPGEFWYVEPIWNQLKKNKNLEIFFSVNDDFNVSVWTNYVSFLVQNGVDKKQIISKKRISSLYSVDLFMSPTAWTSGIPQGDSPKIQIFHTLGSKSTLSLENLLRFNVLFLTGPEIMNQLNQSFFKRYPRANNIKIFEIGYPKSDALIKKSYNKEEIMRRLSIDPAKPTVIYAPNWESVASLHQMGHKIIQTLAKMDINLLIKLHHGSYHNPINYNATGGIDWKKEMEKYHLEYPNVINILDLNSNPYLYVSDMMVTDAGGVGFEFILLDKPIVYIDVPEYFERYGRDGIDYWGRYAGIIVKRPEELPEAVQSALDSPMEKSTKRKELINRLVYNPGSSAEKASKVILQLLENKDKLN